MEAILFAFISYFSWGTGVLVEAIAARRLRSYSLIFWGHLLSILLLSFYVPFAIKDLVNFTPTLIILILSLALVGIFLGTIFYYEALRVGNPALIGTIASSFPAVTVVLSIIFLGEKISGWQILAIMVIFSGLLLVLVDLKAIRSKNLINKGSLFALLAMLSWGIYFAFIKIPVQKVGWFWPNYLTFLLSPLLAYFYINFKKVRLEKPTENKGLVPLVLFTILVRIAELSYSFAISRGMVTIVAPIAGANPTLFVVLAFLIFKDPITRRQVVGIITTLIGIVLLSFLSV